MLSLEEGIVPPVMNTNALAVEAWPPLTSGLKESAESEFDAPLETTLVVHRSENGSIICLYESTRKAASASHDTMESAFTALAASNEVQAETYEVQNDCCNSFEYLNEIAFDDEQQIQSATNEFQNASRAVQFEDDAKSALSVHVKELAVETRAEIDTAVPFESVKQAVNMFGGKADWKAQRILTMERRQYVAAELQKTEEELTELKRLLIVTEYEKSQAIQEMNKIMCLIKELTLNLESANTLERQVTHNSEFARLGGEDKDNVDLDEENVIRKTQLEVEKERNASVILELQAVKQELEHDISEYLCSVNLRDIALQNAVDALAASEEVQKQVDALTIEFMTTKNFLDIAQTLCMETEEKQHAVAMAKDQESGEMGKEIGHANQELIRLNHEVVLVRDLMFKLDASSSLLQSLKLELAAVKESELKLGAELYAVENTLCKAEDELELAKIQEVERAKDQDITLVELDKMRENLNKATQETTYLAGAVEPLREELERESAMLEETRKRVAKTSAAVASLEAELNQTRQAIKSRQYGERQSKEAMTELPRALQQAVAEADKANIEAEAAREDMRKAKEEAAQSEAASSTAESRLQAAIKMAEAARASEVMALARIDAMNQSESIVGYSEARTPSITLSFNEYFSLNSEVHEAEELADKRVAAAIAQIDAAKDSEWEILKRLDEANKEIIARREALQVASQKAERANAAKLIVEDQLRKWRAQNGQHRKAGDLATVAKRYGASHNRVSNWKNHAYSHPNNVDNSNEQENMPVMPVTSLGQVLSMKASMPNKFDDERPLDKRLVSKKKKFRLPRFALSVGKQKKHPLK
jgi:hypothetical protein